MDKGQALILRDTLTREQWNILTAALGEFMNSDRWDEFDYDTAWAMCRRFEGRDTK